MYAPSFVFIGIAPSLDFHAQNSNAILLNFFVNLKLDLQGVLAYHGFWGKQKTMIGKINDKQGLLLKPSNGGTLFTKSPYFGYFAF